MTKKEKLYNSLIYNIYSLVSRKESIFKMTNGERSITIKGSDSEEDKINSIDSIAEELSKANLGFTLDVAMVKLKSLSHLMESEYDVQCILKGVFHLKFGDFNIDWES